MSTSPYLLIYLKKIKCARSCLTIHLKIKKQLENLYVNYLSNYIKYVETYRTEWHNYYLDCIAVIQICPSDFRVL